MADAMTLMTQVFFIWWSVPTGAKEVHVPVLISKHRYFRSTSVANGYVLNMALLSFPIGHNYKLMSGNKQTVKREPT
ncbi:hypothetical protein ASE07_26195 [Noviherbaspirillum sp. Root189]|nr:hypothetical protein ASE07_26195 [Noviherbaspirillum sp. Root189]